MTHRPINFDQAAHVRNCRRLMLARAAYNARPVGGFFARLINWLLTPVEI